MCFNRRLIEVDTDDEYLFLLIAAYYNLPTVSIPSLGDEYLFYTRYRVN